MNLTFDNLGELIVQAFVFVVLIWFAFHSFFYALIFIHGLWSLFTMSAPVRYKLFLILGAFVFSAFLLYIPRIFIGDRISMWHASFYVSMIPLPFGAGIFMMMISRKWRGNETLRALQTGWELSVGVIVALWFGLGEWLVELLGVTIVY